MNTLYIICKVGVVFIYRPPSTYLHIYLPHPSIHPSIINPSSIHPSIPPSIHPLSIPPSHHPSTHPFTHPSIKPSIHQTIYQNINPSLYLSVLPLFTNASIYLSFIHLSPTHPSSVSFFISSSFYLSTYPSTHPLIYPCSHHPPTHPPAHLFIRSSIPYPSLSTSPPIHLSFVCSYTHLTYLSTYLPIHLLSINPSIAPSLSQLAQPPSIFDRVRGALGMVADTWWMTLWALPSAPDTCRLYYSYLFCILLESPDIRYGEMACASSLFQKILYFLSPSQLLRGHCACVLF